MNDYEPSVAADEARRVLHDPQTPKPVLAALDVLREEVAQQLSPAIGLLRSHLFRATGQDPTRPAAPVDPADPADSAVVPCGEILIDLAAAVAILRSTVTALDVIDHFAVRHDSWDLGGETEAPRPR